MSISEAEETKRSKLADKVTRAGHQNTTLMVFMETIPNFTIAFEKDYNENFLEARVLFIVKDMMVSEFLT